MVGSPPFVTNWRKAARCIGNGACLEVAWASARVLVRDSANVAGRVVAYLPDPWRGFIALAEEAKQRGWWEDYRCDSRGYLQVRRLEAEATFVIHWSITDASWAAPDGRLCRGHSHWSARRGASVGAPDDSPGCTHRELPVHLGVVMDESVLLRVVGRPRVMRAQLQHLVAVSDLPNVELRILPLWQRQFASAYAFLDVRVEFARKATSSTWKARQATCTSRARSTPACTGRSFSRYTCHYRLMNRDVSFSRRGNRPGPDRVRYGVGTSAQEVERWTGERVPRATATATASKSQGTSA